MLGIKLTFTQASNFKEGIESPEIHADTCDRDQPWGLEATKDAPLISVWEKNISKWFNFLADIPYLRPGFICHLGKDLCVMSIQVTHTFSAATHSATIHVINTHITAEASSNE